MAIIYQVEVRHFDETSKEEIESFIVGTDEITAEQDQVALLFAFQEDETISTGKITFDSSSVMYDFFMSLKNNYSDKFVFFKNKAFRHGKFSASLHDDKDNHCIIIRKPCGIISYRYKFDSEKERALFIKNNKIEGIKWAKAW